MEQIPNAGLGQLQFDNRFVTELPADPDETNVRRQVNAACYSRVRPQAVTQPTLVAYSREVADLLDLTAEDCESAQFASVFVGNALLEGMDPYATCYGGHQFGQWAGQLGDGRAINLGEIVNRHGERWALQLKGAGPTPYSRTADGLAVLRSSVREFLCSEAMYHLGVPTTRALSLVTTGEHVVRDMFYDGNPVEEPGAVVCRVAPTFTRFGNFQIFTARQDLDVLQRLVAYTMRTDFTGYDEINSDSIVDWFTEICRRTAVMVVEWMRVGFVHGVMNTDNMSILGLTIDYGPYGWLENYDPDWTPNTTDAHGRRYRFGHQPQIALWNLVQLANALYPLVEATEPLEAALNVYGETYDHTWRNMMAGKFGLDKLETQDDVDLVTECLAILGTIETDMTIFFRRLATLDISRPYDDAELIGHFSSAYYIDSDVRPPYVERVSAWFERYRQRSQSFERDPHERIRSMNAVNPKYVLRNYLAQLAIDKAESGDFSMVNELLEVMRRPYDEQPDRETYAARRPDWARQRAGCSMLSCSS